MNDNVKAIQLLMKKISELIDVKCSRLRVDQTFQSVILNVNDDGTYQILHLGQRYTVKNATAIPLKRGQNVWVKIPRNHIKHMHICGVMLP